MSCPQIERYLSAYVDRELAGVEMLRVRAHLRVCEACSREFESMVRMKRLLGGLPAQDPDEALIDRLCAAVEHAPARNVWDWMRERIAEPAARAVALVSEAVDENRVRFAAFGTASMVLVALILAQFAFNPISNRSNMADASGAEGPRSGWVVGEPVQIDTNPMMPLLGPAGSAAGPELQLAVDESVRRHFVEATTAEHTPSGPR